MKANRQQIDEVLYRPATAEEIERWSVEVFGSLTGDSAVASIIRLIRAVADEQDFADRDRLASQIADKIYGLTVDHSTARDTFIAMYLPPSRPTLSVVNC